VSGRSGFGFSFQEGRLWTVFAGVPSWGISGIVGSLTSEERRKRNVGGGVYFGGFGAGVFGAGG